MMECCNDEMMKDMKKNIKVIGYGLWVMVALLLSAPTLAQSFGQQDPNQTQFQSTSTMTGSGSTYAPNPSLNSTGTANAPTYGGGNPGGPYKAVDPISDDEVWEHYKEDYGIGDGLSTPIGDAILPLMVMALAYAVYSAVRVYRRKRRV